MARVLSSDIQRAFWQMCQACGFTIAEQQSDVGAYQLDRNSAGWLVERIADENGAVSHPFGDTRYGNTAFIQMLFFAGDVARCVTPEVKVVVVQDQDDEVSDVYVYRGWWHENHVISDAENDQVESILVDEPVCEGDKDAAYSFLAEFSTFTCKTDRVRYL